MAKKVAMWIGVALVVGLLASLLTGVVLAQGPQGGLGVANTGATQPWQGRGMGWTSVADRPFGQGSELCVDHEFVDADGDGVCDLAPEGHVAGIGQGYGRMGANGDGICDGTADGEPLYDGTGMRYGWNNR